MNCIELFLQHAKENPNQPAIWIPKKGITTYGELERMAGSIQKICRSQGLVPGDGVLLAEPLGAPMYAAVIGILGMGCHVVLVEPWMPLQRINHAVSLVKPKLFLTGWKGRFWGSRSKAIREIPKWKGLRSFGSHSFDVEQVEEESHGIITFTSGTTGNPKGVVRSQGFLVNQHKAIAKMVEAERHLGPDLCIFANFALTNLASGRLSLIIPPQWKPHHIREAQSLHPETMTCGPAFLRKILDDGHFSSMQSIHVGGALTDCKLFEQAFEKWPEAKFTHVYGSSEAEPVATVDARIAVERSRSRQLYQTLFIGHPVDKIQAKLEPNNLWVTGPHVSPFYLGDDQANAMHKRRDEAGNVWHDMGDRIVQDQDGWWYGGRSDQVYDDFVLEQQIYSFVESSDSFVIRDQAGRRIVFGEAMHEKKGFLLPKFPQLADGISVEICRDPRHRSRIDRKKSLAKRGIYISGAK